MRKQDVGGRSRELTAALDKLNYISQMLPELTKLLPQRAGERLPALLGEAHLEVTEAAARLLAEHLDELELVLENTNARSVRRVS